MRFDQGSNQAVNSKAVQCVVASCLPAPLHAISLVTLSVTQLIRSWIAWCIYRDMELAKFEAFLKKEESLEISALVRGTQHLAYPIDGYAPCPRCPGGFGGSRAQLLV